MGEQRPMFRFRLPWMLPSAPAPAPRPEAVTQSPPRVTTTQTPTTSAETQTPAPAPAPRRPFRFAGIGPSQPPPPQDQTTPRTDSQFTTTQMQAPTTQTTPQTPSPAQAAAAAAATSTPPIPPTVEKQSPTETTTTPTPTIPPQIPPLRSPRQVAVQEPLPQAEPLSKTESRPSSPSRASPQSRAAFQPPLPARVSTRSQAASQPSSPALPQPQKSSQISSIPSSPSLKATNVEPTRGTATLPPSPSKTLKPIDSSQPPPSSHKALSPVSKEEQNLAVPRPQQSLEAQSKTDIRYGPISTSPIKATIQPTVTAAQPSKQPGPTEATALIPVVAKKIPFPTTKPDDYPKSLTNLDGYPVETKTEKEMVQNTTAVAHEEPKQKTVAEYLTEESGLIAPTKEQPKVAYQAEEKQLEKHEMVHEKEVPSLSTSILNGKQTKPMISQQKDKSTASESRSKPMVSNGERVSLQKEIRNDLFKLVRRMSASHPEHLMEKKPLSVISLVDENRGASMQLDFEAAKREVVHIHRAYKINADGSAEATNDGEESSKGRRSKDANTKEDQVTKSYINSNIQNINNSILLNSSISERNPGVHLALPHYPTEPIKSNDRAKSHETRKVEVNITPSKRLTYEPTVLRDLYMEPIESDPDNPAKPWSLGSNYGCSDENKDNEIDVI